MACIAKRPGSGIARLGAVALGAALQLGIAQAASAPTPTQHAQYDHVSLDIPADWESTMSEHELWSLAHTHDLSQLQCAVSVSPAGRGVGNLLMDFERNRQSAVPGNLRRAQPVVRTLAQGWSVAAARFTNRYIETISYTLLVFAKGSDIQVVTLVNQHSECSAQAEAVLRSLQVGDRRARVDPQGLAWPLPRPTPAPPTASLGTIAGQWDGLVRIGPYLSHQNLALGADGHYTLVERSKGKTLYAGTWRLERDRLLLADASSGRLAAAFTLEKSGVLRSDQQDVFTRMP